MRVVHPKIKSSENPLRASVQHHCASRVQWSVLRHRWPTYVIIDNTPTRYVVDLCVFKGIKTRKLGYSYGVLIFCLEERKYNLLRPLL